MVLEDVQAVDDKVIFQTSRKRCKNFHQREITHRQDDVELWLFQTRYDSNKDKCQVSSQSECQNGDDKFILHTKNYSKELSNSRANNSSCSSLITPIIKLIRDLKSHKNFDQVWNWLIFVDATV